MKLNTSFGSFKKNVDLNWIKKCIELVKLKNFVKSLPYESKPASILSIKFGAPGRILYFSPAFQMESHNSGPKLESFR